MAGEHDEPDAEETPDRVRDPSEQEEPRREEQEQLARDGLDLSRERVDDF